MSEKVHPAVELALRMVLLSPLRSFSVLTQAGTGLGEGGCAEFEEAWGVHRRGENHVVDRGSKREPSITSRRTCEK